jgi:hypothetical protein
MHPHPHLHKPFLILHRNNPMPNIKIYHNNRVFSLELSNRQSTLNLLHTHKIKLIDLIVTGLRYNLSTEFQIMNEDRIRDDQSNLADISLTRSTDICQRATGAYTTPQQISGQRSLFISLMDNSLERRFLCSHAPGYGSIELIRVSPNIKTPSSNPDLHSLVRFGVASEMRTATCNAEEGSGDTLDFDGVRGAGHADKFAMLGVDYCKEIVGDDRV